MTDAISIPTDEFTARRDALRAKLGSSVGLIFAGDYDSHADAPFRPHPHFEYLTGVTDEPGAVLMLDPVSPVERRREMLFLRPLNPEVEKWDGYRLEIGSVLRKRTGFDAIYRLGHLPQFLGDAARRSKSLACLHPLSRYDQPVSPDLAVFHKVCERVPGVAIDDRSELLASMRAVKSNAEVAMIQRAIDITARGFEAMLQSVRPGMNEFDVQEVIEHAYRTNGARSLAFPAIVGSGVNSTVLHYRANNKTIEEGDLICIDSGAAYGGYHADITRTVPASGRFTKRQREVYEVVLRAEEAAIKAVKAGVRLAEIDAVARAIITKAGFGDAFIHSIGHHLGIETHDASPDEPLKAGAVITIEPGIYLPDEKIGIRIEDDVLVTRTGAKNLSKDIPKSVADIERIMAG